MTYDPTCIHCDEKSFALENPLETTDHFRIVADVHPLTEGHLLIIPKDHITCAGAFPQELFTEFVGLYEKFSRFIKKTYGEVSSFEHGITGQTVFHAHVHILPFAGKPADIVPEGAKTLFPIKSIRELPDVFERDGRYLFFSIGEHPFLVDTAISVPRFFRDRFAKALGVPETGNWKTMKNTQELMARAKAQITSLVGRFHKYRYIDNQG